MMRKNPVGTRSAVLAIAGAAVGLVALMEELRSQVSVSNPDVSTSNARRQRFSHNGTTKDEGPAAFFDRQGRTDNAAASGASEAPAGFDNLTNGLTPQGPAFASLTADNVVPLRSFNDNRFVFEEVETIADGLGPVYNAQSCRECHQNVVTGGAAQVTEHRTGRTSNGEFFNSLGGSLIQSRATNAELVEHVAIGDDIRTFRVSVNTLGDGFIEAIANSTLTAIRDGQPAEMRGVAILVPVLEGDGSARIGRFGWKSQHASLLSFSADAYNNEMGITSPLLPEENTSNGRFVGYGSGFDPVPEPEDDGTDLAAFASFMRSTKVPARGAITGDVTAGENVFNQVGCATCHVATIATAPAGTMINGGAFTIPAALGNKVIHPYSDFLLHDIGTGDGIPILPTADYAATANQIRTAPLWALRTRNRLMHDGLTFTTQEAIQRHAGQASSVIAAYNALPDGRKNQLLRFLDSL
jgi:CxxC motif-containing protein (DUF1111 family)